MKVFKDEKYNTLSDDEKTTEVIKFIMNALILCGHKRDRIFTSGYLGEAQVAALYGLELNPSAQGYDAKHKDGASVELKISHADLGFQTNFNFTAPEKDSKEKVEEYYTRLSEINRKKGDILLVHNFTVDEESRKNEYRLGHEFLTYMMRFKDIHLSKTHKLNLGGESCLVCTKVHRVKYLEEIEREWIKDKNGFDQKKLGLAVPAKCKSV